MQVNLLNMMIGHSIQQRMHQGQGVCSAISSIVGSGGGGGGGEGGGGEGNLDLIDSSF